MRRLVALVVVAVLILGVSPVSAQSSFEFTPTVSQSCDGFTVSWNAANYPEFTYVDISVSYGDEWIYHIEDGVATDGASALVFQYGYYYNFGVIVGTDNNGSGPFTTIDELNDLDGVYFPPESCRPVITVDTNCDAVVFSWNPAPYVLEITAPDLEGSLLVDMLQFDRLPLYFLGASAITVDLTLDNSSYFPIDNLVDLDGVYTQPESCGGVVRAAGLSRFGTAAAVSADAFPSGSTTVFVANGLNFPDALAGGVAAALSPGPVLLVGPDSIPAETAAELTRLAPSEIVILGGTAAVSASVEATLGSYAATVRRLAGPDRFSTAAAIAADAFPSGTDTVFLSDGLNYPDALAGVPAAAKLGGPLLLTRSGSLPAVTADEIVALGASRVVILGGTGAVSTAVETAVGALSGVTQVDRWAGLSRFGTAAEISQQAWPSGADTVYVAFGLNFPDALAGGPAAFLDDGPLLLVRTDSIPTETAAEITRLAPSRIVILGGTGVVSATVATQLDALLP